MSQAHLFILDCWDDLKFAKDSSLAMAKVLEQKGHRVYCSEVSHLSWLSTETSPSSLCQKMSFSSGEQKPSLEPPKLTPLTDFHTIQVRKEPPVDFSYFAMTYILEAVEDKVKIHNSPKALRDFNEKLAIFKVSPWAIPSLVSQCENEVFDFIEQKCQSDFIIKPLPFFGGQGVKRFSWSP